MGHCSSVSSLVCCVDALQHRTRSNTGNSGFCAFRWNINAVYVLCNVICMLSSAEVSIGNGVTIPTRSGGELPMGQIRAVHAQLCMDNGCSRQDRSVY